MTAGWQHWVDRLACFGWRLLLVSVAIALVGGVLTAAVWRPSSNAAPVAAESCPEPPCFDLGLSDIHPLDVPGGLALLGYVLVCVLGVPSLLVGLWDLRHRRWAVGGRRVLAFLGPAIFLVGTETLPHLLLPCPLLRAVCEDLPEHGWSVTGRWHLLDHTLVGALPLAALYGWARHRWRPTSIR